MGFLKWLVFGGKSEANEPIATVAHLARGRGYTQQIVGESHYQKALGKIAGPKCGRGCKLETVARLEFETANRHDPNAIKVLVRGHLVGFIPREDAAKLRAEVLPFNSELKPVACDAKVVGGWIAEDGFEGSYGVKLSLSRPLKVKS